MCDYSTLAGLLAGGLTAVVAAAVLIAAALAANLSFFGAPGALPVAVSAAASSAFAAGLIGAAVFATDTFISCLASTYGGSICWQAAQDFTLALTAVAAVFATQAAFITAALITGAIPFGGAVALTAWGIVCTGESILLGIAAAKLTDLESCMNRALGHAVLPGWLFVFFGLAIIATATVGVYGIFSKKPGGPPSGGLGSVASGS